MAKDHNFDNFDWLERGCGRNDLLDSISQSVNQFSMDSWRMDTPIPRQYPQYPLQDAPTGYGYGHGLGVSYQEDSVMSTPAYTGPIDFQSISTSMPQNGPDSMQSPMFLPPTAATRPNRRPQKDGWTKDEDNLLLTLRKEGWEYSQIAEEMRTKLGVNRTENCLVKRLQKIQVQYLEVSSFSVCPFPLHPDGKEENPNSDLNITSRCPRR